MGKIDRRHIKAIQKKVLKDVKHQSTTNSKTQKRSEDKIIMAIHEEMDSILHTDAIVYQDFPKRKHGRVPKIRKICHKIR